LIVAFVYVRKHSEKWTIMSFVAAALFGFATVAQLALAAAPPDYNRSDPSRSSGPSARPIASPPTSSPTFTPTLEPASADLSYRLSASSSGPRTVRVAATASGQSEPGLTYRFILQVDYGKGYVECYPRQKMTGRAASFDVTIPDGADTQYVRSGRIYGPNSAQNAQAEEKFARQRATGVNDFFTKETGQPVSDKVKLPY
jgi:hypothetical protein